MKKLWIRLFAGVLASVLAVAAGAAAMILVDRNGHRGDGLFYQATGIRPDAQLLTVDGTAVEAEEYLYWLAYDCEYLSSYMGSIDWDASITEEMTYGDYAKTDALETVKMFAVVRRLAKEHNITLSQEDEDALAQQRTEYVSYYGDEAAYADQIRLMGVSEAAFARINAGYYLLNRVADAACTESGALYPGEEALLAHSQSRGFLTARLLYLSTAELSETEIAARRALAEDDLRQLQETPSSQAAYDLMGQMIAELGLQSSENDLTFTAESADPALYDAVSKLEEQALSGVIEAENGFYVAMRMPLDLDAVAQDYFSSRFTQLRQEASVTTSRAYDRLNTGAFYTRLLTLRQELAAQLRGE